MKRLFFFSLLLFIVFGLPAQNITISFQPKVTGNQIDSVWVTNQRTNQKVKLLGSESLLLDVSTGIDIIKKIVEDGTLYPNPGYGDATLVFSTNRNQNVMVSVYNMSGQVSGMKRQELSPGQHTFQLKFPVIGLYVVSVQTDDGGLSFKAACMGVKMQECRIEYAGSESPKQLKSAMTGKTLGFTLGDILQYSVSSGKNNTIVMDSPTASKVYSVEFYECMDKDNQNYPIVRIGNQWWMAGNLKTTKYHDGSSIPLVTENTQWAGLTSGAYCWYNNLESNNNIYGAIYNWYTVADSRGVCPAGWHMPVDDEWTVLENYMIAHGYNYDGTATGNKIAKSLASATGWNTFETAGTPGNDQARNNSSGFSALPGGYRAYDGPFRGVSFNGYWWSSTKMTTADAWNLGLGYESTALVRSSDYILYGFSVRCVRDFPADPASLNFSMIGSSSSWLEDVDFTYIGSTGNMANYRIPSRNFMQNEEFKIRVGHKWDQSYGYNNIIINGESANFFSSSEYSYIGVRSERVYEVTLQVNWSNYAVTLVMNNLTPSVTTNTATSITPDSAVSGGNILNQGSSPVTARGVCWNTTGTPTTAGNKTSNGTGTGPFTSSLTGLTSGTPYYVRAYATNSQGTSYGNQVVFTSAGQIINPPTVITSPVTGITQTTATGGGNVTSDGGATVTARGVCWNTSSNPALDNKLGSTSNGMGTGTFTSNLTGLTPGYHYYYVRAYATNSAGTAYGEQKQFRAKNQTGTFQDTRDNMMYDWVKIGTQVWMAKNLAYLPSVSPPSAVSGTSPFYFVYGYEGTIVSAARASSNYSTYGTLYNWPSALTACPAGWHLPSDAEWTTLENYMIANGYNYDGTTTENNIAKSLASATGWDTSATTGTPGNDQESNNSSGFSALPGGFSSTGFFLDISYYGTWWSSTEEYSTGRALNRALYADFARVARSDKWKDNGLSVRCVRDVLPTVTTASITNIAQTTATSGGNVTLQGETPVTARGVCWSTSQNPTVANSKTTDGTGTGSFTSSITGLTAGTLYYVRAYATNSAGTAYGEQKQFRAKNETGSFEDRRGVQIFYTWVKIGTQTWMASNLCYLPSVSPSSEGSESLPYYYVYGYEGTNVTVARNLITSKGVLYNFPAALTACPSGWHLPTDAEWTTLENYLIANKYNFDGTTTDNKIAKSLASVTGWNTSETAGTPGNDPASNNSSGFSALSVGFLHYYGGGFGGVGNVGFWWSSTEDSTTGVWNRILYSSTTFVKRDHTAKGYGFSVRCLRD